MLHRGLGWLTALALIVPSCNDPRPEPDFAAQSPAVEVTNLELGIRTSIWRSQGGRRYDVHVYSFEPVTRANAVGRRIPATGTVRAYLDRNADGRYTPGVDDLDERIELTPAAADAKEPERVLAGELLPPPVWRESEPLSFEIDLQDEQGKVVLSFSFRIPRLAR